MIRDEEENRAWIREAKRRGDAKDMHIKYNEQCIEMHREYLDAIDKFWDTTEVDDE